MGQRKGQIKKKQGKAKDAGDKVGKTRSKLEKGRTKIGKIKHEKKKETTRKTIERIETIETNPTRKKGAGRIKVEEEIVKNQIEETMIMVAKRAKRREERREERRMVVMVKKGQTEIIKVWMTPHTTNSGVLIFLWNKYC